MPSTAPVATLLLQAPVVVLAGWPTEELGLVRELLDAIGGQEVKVVPCTPALLAAPTRAALAAPEPRWEAPRPPDYVPGGGWGQQRMALMNGIE